MKKRKNILLVIASLLLLGVTVYALVSGGGMVEHSAETSSEAGLLEEAMGMINQSLAQTKP